MRVRSASLADVRAVLPKRKPEAHKGDYGRLLVVGGSSRYTGAPALLALAALRSGVDLVTVAAPAEAAKVISSFSPDLITVKLPCEDLEPGSLAMVAEELKRCEAVAIGSGLGTLPQTHDAVIGLAKTLAEKFPGLPALFDADGLKAAASERGLLKNPNWVLTPHAREFELLTGSDLPPDVKGRVNHVKLAARELGCVILLKAHVDVIASPKEVALNRTGNPGMTVGGTGDVLAGIVGAFLAQGADPFKAALAGAFVSGRAGDLCLKEKGFEFIPSDVIEKLPEVFKEARRRSRGQV